MRENQSLDTTVLQKLHAATFSLNVSFVFFAAMFLCAPRSVISRFNQLEFFTNRLLSIRQTDLVLGYWEFLLPSTALAICLWVLLRPSIQTGITLVILRYVAGITAIGAAPAYWLCATYLANRRYGWSPFHSVQLYELSLILVLAFLYLLERWPVPVWASAATLCAHYSFWFWQFWPQVQMAFKGYGAAPGFAALTSFCAGLTWLFYVRSDRLEVGPQALRMRSSRVVRS